MSLEKVFRGLADKTRREILRILARRDQSIADVADHFDISRTAVKKHLQILQDGGLIAMRTKGRTRISTLNAKALKPAEDWIQFFNGYWDNRLGALENALEDWEKGTRDMTDTLTKSAFFSAPREVVWRFLTDKDMLGDWYHPARNDLAEGQEYELYRKDEGSESTRVVWGRVLSANPPSELICTFEIPYLDGGQTTLTWTLDELAGGTKLTLRHDGIGAASGEAADQLLTALDQGWDKHLASMRDAIIAEPV